MAHREGTPIAKIVIIDDHPIVREGLISRIAEEPDLQVCGEADGVAGALTLIDATRPDVAIVDISLEDGDGMDLIRRLVARRAQTRLLVWSMYPEDLYAERAIQAGALGYINKQKATSRIIEAIRSVLDGRVFLSQPIVSELLRRAVGGASRISRSPLESLSDRELQVFRLIGEGITVTRIADRMHLSVHTIETYRHRIKHKLGLRNAPELSRAAIQWVLEHRREE